MAENPCISRIEISDRAYEVKDAEARALLEALFSEEIVFDGGTAPINNEK